MARDYRVELVDSREARLKFGFGGMGWQPQAGDEFIAAFRVGSGAAGNVGIDAIAHIILPKGSAAQSKIIDEGVSNLLPAVGGQGRESLETARLLAPANLQTQARCVTLADYEDVARLHPDVAEARAHWKWVANAHIVVLHIRRRNGLPVDRAFRQAFLDYMQPYQIVGSDIQVRGPSIWPVYLWLTFTPAPYASRNGLREALKAAFSDRDPAGFFYHQNFSLGQPLYRSQIITHASRLTGIQEVSLVHFCSEPFGNDCVEQVISVPSTAMIGLQDLEIIDD
jgi:predicted phage baseplate assembly protein